MAKKGRMTRRRRGHKKSMRKGTRKQQKGGACTACDGYSMACTDADGYTTFHRC